jgi:hypothetical protein
MNLGLNKINSIIGRHKKNYAEKIINPKHISIRPLR